MQQASSAETLAIPTDNILLASVLRLVDSLLQKNLLLQERGRLGDCLEALVWKPLVHEMTFCGR